MILSCSKIQSITNHCQSIVFQKRVQSKKNQITLHRFTHKASTGTWMSKQQLTPSKWLEHEIASDLHFSSSRSRLASRSSPRTSSSLFVHKSIMSGTQQNKPHDMAKVGIASCKSFRCYVRIADPIQITVAEVWRTNLKNWKSHAELLQLGHGDWQLPCVVVLQNAYLLHKRIQWQTVGCASTTPCNPAFVAHVHRIHLNTPSYRWQYIRAAV